MAPKASPIIISKFNRTILQLLGILLIVISIAYIMSNRSDASVTTLDATDVIGQLVPTTNQDGTLTFTSGVANNSEGSVNNMGFSYPVGSAYDASRNRLFVSDVVNNRVLVFDLDDAGDQYYVADYVLGAADFTSAGTGSGATGFTSPTGLAYDDTNSRLFISDNANSRVLVFDVRPAGSGTQTSCGVATTGIANGMSASCAFGNSDLVGGAASGLQAATDNPVGLAYDDATGFLYVAQLFYNRVTVFHAALADITTNGMDAFHVFGQLDFTGTTAGWDDLVYGAGAPSLRSLSGPNGIALDPSASRLYVTATSDGRVLVFDTSSVEATIGGDTALYILGKAFAESSNWLDPLDIGAAYTETPRQDSMFSPVGLVVDTTNKLLYVADTQYQRITVYDVRPEASGSQSYCGFASTGIATGMNASCVFGQSSFTATSGGTTASKMDGPFLLTLDPVNHLLYVPETGNNRVLIFDVTTLANNPSAVNNLGQVTIATTYTYDGSTSLTANGINSSTPIVNENGFNGSSGVTIDTENHRMFVADSGNHRILVFNLGVDNTLTDYTADNVLGQSNFLNNSAATTATGLSSPRGITYWHAPSGTQYLFVADIANNRVLAYDVGSITDGESAVAVIGQTSFTANDSGAATQINLASPADVAVDAVNNRLYVADSKANRVLAYDIATLIPASTPAMAVIGQDGYTTDNSGTSAGNLNEPSGLFYDPDGQILFISDTRNNRVLTYNGALIVDGSHGVMATKVLGQSAFGVTTAALSQAGMTNPQSIDYDAENKIAFVSTSDNRVLLFDVTSITNGENAIAVIGQPDFTSGVTGTSSSLLNSPNMSYFDNDNNFFYLADAANNRVLKFEFITLVTASISSSAQVGAAYTAPLTTANSQGTVSFELVSGTMPTGVSFDATGIIGTPTVAGTYNFVVRAVDAVGASAFRSNQQSYSIVVASGGGGGGGGGGTSLCNDPLANNYNQPASCQYDPPSISIVNPQPNGSYTSSTNTIVINGVAADIGTITSVLYSWNRASAVSAVGTTTWSTTLLTLLPGSNTFTVTAYNNYGLQTSRSLTVVYTTVTPPDTCATNPNLPGCTIVVNPPLLCLEPAATNYNQSLPCVYPQPIDICSNLSGLQTSLPVGYEVTLGICTLIPVIVDPVDPPVDPGGGGGGGVIIPPDPVVEVVTTTVVNDSVSVLGIVVGFLAMLLSMFGGTIALSELAFVPARAWQLILGALGFGKKVRHWGVVYDSITKQPLDPAYVSLFDENGKEVATAITDLEGRYGFLVQPGTYRIEAHKTNYIFPSRKLAGKTSDQIYTDIYFGAYFEIKTDGEVVVKNIPLDPEHFDWNEYIKNEKHLVKSHAGRARAMAILSDILFYGGFTVSLVALYLQQSTFNFVIVSIYVFLFILRQFIIKKPSYGAVSASGEPLPFGVVKIYSSKLGTLLSTKVLDKYGRYYMLAPKGSYVAKVEKKNDDQSYSELKTTNPFDNNKGVINRKFKV